MKNISLKLSGFVLLIVLISSCSKEVTTSSSGTLKDAVTASSQNLNNAMTDIASNQAFAILAVSNSTTLKSGTVYSANIPLSLVQGTYDYKALKSSDSRSTPLIKFFTKTAATNKMVVNLPLSKLKNPREVREYRSGDSTLANNFSISVTDYHNNYNNYHDYDYVNVADISIDKASAGNLNIKSVVSPTTGTQYASQFTFTNGYTAKYAYASGDTTVSSFAISKAATVLYEEKLTTVKSDTGKFGHERRYTLTIGDVKIVRNPNHTTDIYVKNVLQTKAVVTVLDSEDNENKEHSVTGKRDIQITFDDGTVSTVSALIGKSIDNISTLFTSLHEVYFAAYVVDWLGYDVYYKR